MKKAITLFILTAMLLVLAACTNKTGNQDVTPAPTKAATVTPAPTIAATEAPTPAATTAPTEPAGNDVTPTGTNTATNP